MSFLSRIRGRVGRERVEGAGPDRGAPAADHRDEDGAPGTSAEDTFVGRTSGQDSGYLDTGAERRAAGDADSENTDQRES
jgi:hypothetical protein